MDRKLLGRVSSLVGAVLTTAVKAAAHDIPGAGIALARDVIPGVLELRDSTPYGLVARQVADGVAQWATSEGLGAVLEVGLDQAQHAIATYGPDDATMAKLAYEPGAIADAVIAKAWARAVPEESEAVVAKRAIRETYTKVVPVLAREPEALSALVIEVRATQERQQAILDRLARQNLPPDPDDDDVRLAVMTYLRARIRDWNQAPGWLATRGGPVHSMSRLRRRLAVRTTGEAPADLDEDEALVGTRMLVVLGGPGSGKTWLSRSYAVEAAQDALDRLAGGTALAQVEIPLWTTWRAWHGESPTYGRPVDSLVASSFAGALGVSAPDQVEPIVRALATTGGHRLAWLGVVDSLDEAPDVYGGAPLDALAGLPSNWRVVTTSRPEEWQRAQRGRDVARDDAARVVELLDLRYPDDVEAFVRAWFGERAPAVIAQFRQRRDVQAMARVPLLLAFCCLVSDEDAGHLPAYRFDLYEKVARRLLRAEHRAGTEPDFGACLAQLTQWAGAAVQAAGSARHNGMGSLVNAIATGQVPHALKAVDHVAPVVADDGYGHKTRAFLHQTMLEHFASRHIAGLAVDDAVHVLWPHLWYDPGWAYVIPAAIARHPRRNEVLTRLIEQASSPVGDPVHHLAHGAVDQLLAALPEASAPADWDAVNRTRIESAWVRAVAMRRGEIGDAAGRWVDARTQPELVGRLSRQLARANRWEPPSSVNGLLGLIEAGEPAAAMLETAIEAAIHEADPWDAGRLAGALVRMEDTDAHRDRAFAAVRDAIPEAVRQRATSLVETLTWLADTPGRRTQAVDAVTSALAGADPWTRARLADALVRLDDSPARRRTAIEAIEAVLPGAEPWMALPLTDALVRLATTPELVQAAVAAIVRTLPVMPPGIVGRAATALVRLDDSPERRREAIAAIAAVIPDVKPGKMSPLTEALVRLADTGERRAQAVAIIAGALPSASLGNTEPLLAALLTLSGTPALQGRAVRAIESALPTADRVKAVRLTGALFRLVGTVDARQRAIVAVERALSAAGPATVPWLVDALVLLQDGPAQRRTAIAAVVRALGRALPATTLRLVETLVRLEDTPEHRGLGIDALVQALPYARGPAAYAIAGRIVGLADTAARRQQAAAALASVAPTLPDAAARGLRGLSSPDEWLAWLRDGSLPADAVRT